MSSMSISALQKIISDSQNIVFFGGAGVSTESGIPDFRSVDGLFSQRHKPETILSRSFFDTHTEEFFAFYCEKMLFLDAQPGVAHKKLAELEAAGRLKAVITQNIDGLHQKAGSRNVLELHGSVHRNYCLKCRRLYDAQYMLDSRGVPLCACGGQLRPDVVLYEEPLDSTVLDAAVRYISNADVLIVGGTSLAVYPAAGLLHDYHGGKLVLINKTPTPYDAKANLVIAGSIGEALGGIRTE